MRAHGEEELSGAVLASLSDLYGIDNASLRRVHAGTATDNFIADRPDADTPAAFVKVYRDRDNLSRDEAAISLALFARDGDVPVPALLPTRAGHRIGRRPGLALSVWEHIDASLKVYGRARHRAALMMLESTGA